MGKRVGILSLSATHVLRKGYLNLFHTVKEWHNIENTDDYRPLILSLHMSYWSLRNTWLVELKTALINSTYKPATLLI